MAEIGSFRSRLFGGFDRKDVASYIEKLAAERNDYIVMTRDLEASLDNLKEEMEALKNEYAKKEAALISEYEGKIDAVTCEYENKLTAANEEISNLKAALEEKNTAERDETKALLDTVIERFTVSERDNTLICATLKNGLEEAIEKVSNLPDIIASSRERIEEIREKLD